MISSLHHMVPHDVELTAGCFFEDKDNDVCVSAQHSTAAPEVCITTTDYMNVDYDV